MPRSSLRTAIARLTAMLGGAAFLASIVWTVTRFAGEFGVNTGPWTNHAGGRAVFTNTLLFVLFVAHHSGFARAPAKAWVASIVSPALERSVYVWVSSALLALLAWQWLPVPGLAWQVSGVLGFAFAALQVAGVALTLLAVSQLDVWSFSGMRPARKAAALQRHGLYAFVRHPIYFAWLLMVWPTATMTGSRLLFAGLTTMYLVVAVPFEERSLRQEFGPDYDAYRRSVRWRMLPGVY